MIGRLLSHYRISEVKGSGGMGTVYRAEDTLLGRPVALKFPHPSLIRDQRARERFLREARAASALDHPNVVVLYDVCEVDGEIFLATQYVEGEVLQDRIRSAPLSERRYRYPAPRTSIGGRSGASSTPTLGSAICPTSPRPRRSCAVAAEKQTL